MLVAVTCKDGVQLQILARSVTDEKGRVSELDLDSTVAKACAEALAKAYEKAIKDTDNDE